MCIRDRHSDDISIGSKMTNDKGKIGEEIVVENKAENRPSDNDESVVVVNKGKKTNQFQENKVSGWGEFGNSTEFMREFERVLRGMTEDDWRKLNNELRQMREQKTGLYAFLNENSDDTRKQSNEVREGVALDNKILNNDNYEIKMGINGEETDQLSEKDDQITENEVSKNSVKGNRITDENGVNTYESVGVTENCDYGGKLYADENINNKEIGDKVSGSNTSNYNDEITLNKNNDYIVEKGVSKNDTVSNGGEIKNVVLDCKDVSKESVDEVISCLLYTSRCV